MGNKFKITIFALVVFSVCISGIMFCKSFSWAADDMPVMDSGLANTTPSSVVISLDGSVSDYNHFNVSGVGFDYVTQFVITNQDLSSASGTDETGNFVSLGTGDGDGICGTYDDVSNLNSMTCTFTSEIATEIESTLSTSFTDGVQTGALYFFMCTSSDCSSISTSTTSGYETESFQFVVGNAPSVDSAIYSTTQLLSTTTSISGIGSNPSYGSNFYGATVYFKIGDSGSYTKNDNCVVSGQYNNNIDCSLVDFSSANQGDKIYLKIETPFGTYDGSAIGKYWTIVAPVPEVTPNSGTNNDGEDGSVTYANSKYTVTSGVGVFFDYNSITALANKANWDGEGFRVKFGNKIMSSGTMLMNSGGTVSDGCSMLFNSSSSEMIDGFICSLPKASDAVGRLRSASVGIQIQFYNSDDTVAYASDAAIYTYSNYGGTPSDTGLCSGVEMNGTPQGDGDVEAECDIDINYSIKEQITLQINKGITTITTPADGGSAVDSGDLYAEVKTNAKKGYQLSINGIRNTGGTCAANNLLCTGIASNSKTFPTLSSSGILTDNTWGYAASRADNQPAIDPNSTIFQRIPEDESSIVTLNGTFSNMPTAGERTWLFFGAKTTGATPAGDYSGKVRITAFAKI
ncbi:MAG: hypothetical protein LBM13_06485 [Candidatus Ancillula sp.]|nr:hypothetical protein [Candidatus Ancillula sp.]